jgi:rare lipoprotein A
MNSQDKLNLVVTTVKSQAKNFVVCGALAAVGFLIIFIHGCSQVNRQAVPSGYPKPYSVGGKEYQPLPHARDFHQRGIASWYGVKFHGRTTSSGEVYDMHSMTAAHKTLPFGTYVKIQNLNNGRRVKVRINDRGPFCRGRIIDLSYRAAKELGIVNTGTTLVEITAIGILEKTNSKTRGNRTCIPLDYDEGNFSIQVGAFSTRENADRLKRELERSHENVHITVERNGYETFYRVRVGKCSSLKKALAYEKILIQDGFNDAFAIAE